MSKKHENSRKKNNNSVSQNTKFPPIPTHPENELAPLSFAQEQLWFIEQYEEGTDVYHCPWLYYVSADIDVGALEKAIQKIAERHTILRTTFVQQRDGTIAQKVNSTPLRLNIENVTTDLLPKRIEKIVQKPFDLTKKSPVYAVLLKNKSLDSKPDTLLVLFHHLLVDGFSRPIFEKELRLCYQAIQQNKPIPLKPLTFQYKDFAIWQRQQIDNFKSNLLPYWLDKLADHMPTSLPTDYTRPVEFDYRGDCIFFDLSDETVLNLRRYADKHDVTRFTILLTAFGILLSRYTSQNDLLIGTPVTNRDNPQLKNLIGFLANAMPLRLQLNPGDSLETTLQNVKHTVLEIKQHKDLPFEQLVEALNVTRDPSKNPLFQILFTQVYRDTEESEIPEIQSVRRYSYDSVTKFDLDFRVTIFGSNIAIRINYATSLFKKDTILRFARHYERILSNMMGPRYNTISEYPLLFPEEYQTIVYDWNKTKVPYHNDKTIHQRFEEQVEEMPDNIALVFEDQTLTYQALNERSNQLAHHLRHEYKKNHGESLKPDTLIAICLERSLEMLIAILGVLKAGAAYVPIDPEYPIKRIQFQLEDTQAAFLLTERRLGLNLGKLVGPGAQPTRLIYLDKHPEQHAPKTNPKPIAKPSNLAYVIYTSGTTGKPKGVLQPHSNVIRLFSATQDYYHFNDKDVWTLFHAYVFDFSVWELWGALFYGAKLVIPTQAETKDMALFYRTCVNHGVSILNHTPTAFSVFSEVALKKNANKLSLRHIIFGGEALHASHVVPWLTAMGESRCKLHNMYGITETTVHTTYTPVSLPTSNNLSIGKRLPDLTTYVLDRNQHPVPIGAIGELYVGGAGVARGYLNRHELTVERFIEHPFLENGSRLYRTGDLVRYLSDGNLEYISRNDFQIKIRGYRIELGEIESQLTSFPGVKQAVILPYQRKNDTSAPMSLIAYYVGEKCIEENKLREQLLNALPDYMCPSKFIFLRAFPITINGKLDQKALPRPDFQMCTEPYIAPENERQSKVCQLWRKALGIDRVGITDDFFKLGGHSILAIQLSHQMSEILNSTVCVADLFKYRTIKSLLNNNPEHAERFSSIPSHADTELAPLSFGQQRLWFIEQVEKNTHAYHIPKAYQVSPEVNINALKEAIQAIVKRHTVLRTTLVQKSDGKTWQQVNSADLDVHEKTVSPQSVQNQINISINQVFDLTQTYPIRAELYHLNNSPSILLVTFHHIAFDEWSTAIFEKELLTCYKAIVEGKATPLNPLPIQFKDYAIWQRKQFQHNEKRLLNYWQEKLQGYTPVSLHPDYTRPAQFNYQGETLSFTVSADMKEQLLTLAARTGVTLYTVLLTGLALLLARYADQEDLVIGTPIADRDHPAVSPLIGFLVDTIVLRLQLAGSDSLYDMLSKVQRTFLDAQAHHHCPFEKVVDILGVKRDLSRHPLFQIMFAVEYVENDLSPDAVIQPLYNKTQYKIAKFDLGVTAFVSEKNLSIRLGYPTTLYTSETIHRFAKHYEFVLSNMLNPCYKRISEYPLLLPKEYQTIVYDWNKTDTPYPKDNTIHRLFEAQVKKTPNHIALVFEDQSLTYQELNQRANQLAHYLRDEYQKINGETLKPDTLIAICLGRSLEIVIAILAVLKAGGAYVPLDPEYPADRIRYQLEDTQAVFLLTTRNSLDCFAYARNDGFSRWGVNLHKRAVIASVREAIQNIVGPGARPTIIYLEDHPEQHAPKTNLKLNAKPNDLAYVIYTSGTTGKPKGVMIEHRALINFTTGLEKYFHNPETSVLQYASLVFDASVLEIFNTLLTGSKLVLLEQTSCLSPTDIINTISKHEVSVALLPPSFLSQLPYQTLTSLKTLFVGGEASSSVIMDKWCDGRDLINAYGPTEATVCTTIHRFNKADLASNIGKPCANAQCYILDKSLNPMPIGAIGELYIGGAGLARGYLNQPELTKERFIPNPFATKEDNVKGYSRLYKTGDLVRYLSDGSIEYVGRNDFQVKVRGFRIELGEIEAQLLTCPDIQQAVVLPYQQDNDAEAPTQLVAYYISIETIEEDMLRTHLAKTLPEYMLPSAFMSLPEFPLTINGKLDRKALPKPDFTADEAHYVPPRTEREKTMCDIWATLLSVERVGLQDDFFLLGGNSILAMQLTHNLKKSNYDVAIIDIMTAKTIQNLLKLNHKHPLIKSLSTGTDDLPKRFFVHSVFGGAEIYLSLAEHLSKQFNCIGIENINLITNDTIDDIPTLAKHYITSIENTNALDEPIHLIGWSLGGKIAMEMAYQLEMQGHRDITLFLLDTYLSTNKKTYEQNNLYKLSKKLKNHFEKEQNIAKKLQNSQLSGKLKYTKVNLCQALLQENGILKPAKALKHQIHNIQRVVTQLVNIHAMNTDHDSLLKQHEALLKILLES